MIPQNEPSSEAVSSIAKVIDWVNSRSKYSTNNTIGLPPLNLPKSLCGRVVSVVIWETTHWNLIQNSKDSFAAGKFIRLRNVKEVCTVNTKTYLNQDLKTSSVPNYFATFLPNTYFLLTFTYFSGKLV